MVFLIAEIGQAHDGSLGILHSYIEALSGTGINAIKFQTHVADAESSRFEPFRVKFSYVDKTRYDYWKRMEFSSEQWHEIRRHCDEVGLEFMSSPFSVAAVELLEQVGVQRYKVGSGEVSNHLLLTRMARTGKPVVLSSGMSSFHELDSAVQLLKGHDVDLSILQCTTQYPTTAENVGLNVISELRSRYSLPVGFSDHSGTIFPSLAATALGAEIVEFHACFDRRCFGPDSTASLTIDEMSQLVDGVRFLETALMNPVDKSQASQFQQLKSVFGKSLAVNKDLHSGHVLEFADLEGKKPANHGIAASRYRDVIGRTLVKDLRKWDFLTTDSWKNE